jgi:hypothetical protein
MNNRTYIGIGLIIVMAVFATLLILNWRTAFVQTVKITYQDGCVEVYKNNNLSTPECTQGRLLDYQRQLEYNRTHYGTWNQLNLTIN